MTAIEDKDRDFTLPAPGTPRGNAGGAPCGRRSQHDPNRTGVRREARATTPLGLHRLEQVRERPAHRELLVAALEHDHRLAAPIAIDALDRAEAHDRAAVDLPESFGIERLVELLDRLADERFALAR